jgi:hypothetical protein
MERAPREELAFWLSMSIPDLGGGESGVAPRNWTCQLIQILLIIYCGFYETNYFPLMQIMTKGLFGSGDILKWLGVATEKVVVICLV